MMTTPQPWRQSYPEGMPADIDTAAYASLLDLLDRACQKHADRIACVAFGSALTYRELDRQALALASWLQSLSLPAGSRIALMMPNVPAYLVALLGVLRAGHVLVNINPLFTPRELQGQLQDSGARVIVVLENFAHTLEQVQGCEALEHRVVVEPGDLLSWYKRPLLNFVVRHVKKMVPAWHLPGAKSLRAVLREGRRLPWQAPAVNRDSLAALQYTGGTTGTPKAAMLTHGNLVANVLQVEAIAWPALHALEGKPLNMLTALPLYHVFAMTICGLYGMHAGMTNLLVMNPRDRLSLIKIWRKYSVHIFPGVNTLFNVLLQEPAFRQLDFSQLRLAFGGGMALQRSVAQQWFDLTGQPLIEGYGLSEASPVVTANPTNAQTFSGSIGLPLPETEILILNPEGMPVATGEHGQIAVRGPQVMRGYWQVTEEVASALRPDGFFLTGDIGWMDERGYVYLVDRLKELVIVSGFNVYPSEVEAVVSAHPGVQECAAVGVPHPATGEAVRLFVVPKDETLTAEQLRTWCGEQLARYKCPHLIEFRESLPKSTIGKVLRRELKATK